MSETRPGRVYLEPEPECGAHPGFRGLLHVDALGVHLDIGCEVLTVPPSEPGEPWPMGAWDYLDRPLLVPWHCVHTIEWLTTAELDAQRAPQTASATT